MHIERKIPFLRIKISIFGKLLLGIIAMLFLILVMAFAGISSINKLERTANMMLEETNQHNAIQKLKINFQQLLMPPTDYLVHGNKIEELNFNDLLIKTKAQLNECKVLFNQYHADSFLVEFETNLKEIESLAHKTFALDHPVGNPDGAIMMEEMDAIGYDVIKKIDNVLLSASKEMKDYVKLNQITHIKASRITILLGLFIALSLFIGGFFYVKEITKPIKHLTQTAQKITSGDLSAKAEVKTKDEIESFAKSFNHMIAVLEKTTVSRDYFNHILDGMVDSLIISNAEDKINIVNKATLDILGYSEKELIGKPVTKVLCLETDEEKLSKSESLKKLLKREHAHNVFNIYYTKKGKAIPVSFSRSVIYDKDNNVSGMIWVARHKLNVLKEENNKSNNQGTPRNRFIEAIGEVPLTTRELEIVKLIAEDMSNREIADKLFISIRTVETHRKNIMQKLETKSVIALVHYAAQNGII